MGGGALVNGLEKMAKAMKEAGTKTYAGLKKAGKPTRYEGFKEVVGTASARPQDRPGRQLRFPGP